MDRRTFPSMLALLTVSWAQDLLVSQPSSAQGAEGGSVTLRCSYSTTSKPKVGSYWWVKEPVLVVKNTSQEFMGRVNCTSDQGFLLEKRADIEIQDLKPNDSGRYRCIVNIHGLPESSGNGTELQVMKRASGGLVVSQPSSAQGIEGGSVTLRCSYNSASEPRVGSYRWEKDQGLVVQNTSQDFKGRVTRLPHQIFLSERRADLEIRNLKCNDSGRYRCVVDILGLRETWGNGTDLQVLDGGGLTDPPAQGSVPYLVLGSGLASAFVVSVAGCLLFLYCRRTQGCKAKASRTPCPHQDRTAEADLNYAELVVETEENPMSQREVVTYIAVDTHEG